MRISTGILLVGITTIISITTTPLSSLVSGLSLPLINSNKPYHEKGLLSEAAIQQLRVFAKFVGVSNCYARDWQCGEYCQGETEDTRFIRDFFDPATNTFAYIAVNERLARILVVFRCTVDIYPWSNGAVAQQTKVYWIKDKSVEIHTDFVNRYKSIVNPLMSTLIATIKRYPSYIPTFVGHSLGGALSTIAATHFYSKSISDVPLQLFTFGAPRIGNPAFANYVNQHLYRPADPTKNEVLPSVLRVVHYNDLVPRIEFKLFDYQHNNDEAWIPEPYSNTTLLCCANPLRKEANCADQVVPILNFDIHNYYYGIIIGNADRCVKPAPTRNLIHAGMLSI